MSALWEPITLGEHFLRGAEQYGDRIALSDGTQKVTYRQLAELAEADRERLRQAGVQPHELVIMQMSNGIPFVQMFLALMLEEGYLVDICLIYAMISFLAVIVLTKVYMGVYLEKKEEERKNGSD